MGEPPTVHAATDDGVLGLEPATGTVRWRALAGVSVRDVAPAPDGDGVLAGCGLRGEGLYRVADGATTPMGLEDRWVWGVTVTPDGGLLVGTEPPAVYRSPDGSRTLRRLEGLDAVPSRPDWHFWYEPHEAGHVHGFAVHPVAHDLVLGAVEVGGVVRTADGGETWTDALAGRDCHACAFDPADRDPDRAYVAANGGLFRSRDRGRSFDRVTALGDRYVADLAAADGTLFATTAPAEDAETTTVHRRVTPGDWESVATAPTTGLAGVVAAADGVLVHDASPVADGDRRHVVVLRDHAGRERGRVTVPARVRALAPGSGRGLEGRN